MKAATARQKLFTPSGTISIHAAREGGDKDSNGQMMVLSISIHAAREGGDVSDLKRRKGKTMISIHAAREGGDWLEAYLENH